YQKDDDNRIEAFIVMIYKQFNKQGVLYELYDIIDQICLNYKIPIDKVIPKLVKIHVNDSDYYTIKNIYEKEKIIEEICNTLIDQKPITEIEFDEDYYIENTQLDQ